MCVKVSNNSTDMKNDIFKSPNLQYYDYYYFFSISTLVIFYQNPRVQIENSFQPYFPLYLNYLIFLRNSPTIYNFLNSKGWLLSLNFQISFFSS